MELNDIPHDKKKFPTGVSEVEYDTQKEMDAFLCGLTYADDGDVEASTTFERNGKFVVRVRVGDWGDDDDDDLDDETMAVEFGCDPDDHE